MDESAVEAKLICKAEGQFADLREIADFLTKQSESTNTLWMKFFNTLLGIAPIGWKSFFYRSDGVDLILVKQIDELLRIWKSMAHDVKVPGNHTQKGDVD